MALPKYFFAENPSLPGAGFIIATEAPAYICKIFKFNNQESADSFGSSFTKPFVMIPGYRIALLFYGILGQEEQDIKDVDDFDVAMKQMADFYLQERILANEKYHKRYKID